MQRNTWVGALVVVLMLTLSAAGCASGPATNASSNAPAEGEDAKAKDSERKEEAVPVEVVALERGPIEAVLRFSSNLECENRVEVFSQAKRLVDQLLVEEGDRVKRGQVLLRLQDAEQKSALAKAQSQFDRAQREYERQQQLYAQQLISEQVYNDATYELEQLRLAVEDARRELSYTEVRAPIAGTVATRLVKLGDTVQIGQHLFDLVDFDSMVARVFVPEKHLAAMRLGQETRVRPQSSPEEGYRGRVARIAPIVDPKSGTVKVTIDVGGQAGLRPGMYVDVEISVARHEQALRVPKRAIVYDKDQLFVYRLGEERRVQRVVVEEAIVDKQFIEPKGGFEAGEMIVVAGQGGLKDGALVRLPEDPLPEPEPDSDAARKRS